MSIVYPLSWPVPHGIRAVTFDLLKFESIDVARSGKLTASEIAPPLWTMRVETKPLTEAQHAAWVSFFDKLDVNGTFYGWDAASRFPRLYRPGGLPGGGNGVGTYTAIDTAREVVSLAGLPAGLVLSESDYVALEWTVSGEQKRSLHRIVVGATINGSGAGSVTVRPHVRGDAPGSGTARVREAAAIFRLDPEDRPQIPKDHTRLSSITFSAIERR